jgi:hypothetical protein
VTLHPLVFWTVIDAFPQIAEYQIRLRDDGLHVLLVVREGTEVEKTCSLLAAELAAELLRRGCRELPVRPVLVPEIPRERTVGQKLKRIRDDRTA